jgi:hypothetical protein
MRIQYKILFHPISSKSNLHSYKQKTFQEMSIREWDVHGLVDPLCGTSWDKWNWDNFHRGYRACPGTRKGLHRGYMTCPIGQEEVSFDLSLSQWDRFGTGSLPVPLGQAQPVPIFLSHWDRLCLSQLLVAVGQVWYRHRPSKVGPWPRLRSFLIKNQRGPNRISEFLIKNRYQIGQKLRLKIDFFSLFQ